MADKEQEIIYHFMFPLKTPNFGEPPPSLVSRVPIDEEGEPIESEEEYYSLSALTPEEWLKVAKYHHGRGDYHYALAGFANERAGEFNRADESGKEQQ